MSKKSVQGGLAGWKYICSCGFETLQVASAVAHINSNKDHKLERTNL